MYCSIFNRGDMKKKNVWDKQHGGSHYQKYKIQPSKFVVENELLYPEGCAIKYISSGS